MSFSYENSPQLIFDNLNLNLDSSWKLGLVGRNGSGKTTFLNLLRGKLGQTNNIETNMDFSYFPMQITDSTNITLYELQKQFLFEQWELERELSLMGVDSDIIWQPFDTLSGGEQTKVLLAASFINSSFSLIDEPTNHLDESSRLQVSHYLKRHQSGFIVVSHDREFLNRTVDHVLALENSEIHLYQGNYSQYEDTKKKRDEFNLAKNSKLQRQISSLQASAQRVQEFSNKSEKKKFAAAHKNEQIVDLDRGFLSHKAAKIMKRSKSLEHRLEKNISEKEGLLNNIESIPELTMNFDKNYHSDLVICDSFGMKIAGKNLFDNLSFKIKNQGIMVLKGKNGSGKTTFIKYLLHQADNVNTTGSLTVQEGVKISYLPQDFLNYYGDLKTFAQKNRLSYEILLNNLKKMGFKRSSFTTSIEDMSMGQKKRVAIAKSLAEKADFYIWDEPANYLDIFNQEQLIHLLKAVNPAMLLIEHDERFIEAVSQEVIQLKNREI